MERRRGWYHAHRHGLVLTTGVALASGWMLAVGPSAGAAEAPLPVVTITAVQNGVVLVDGSHPCNDVSTASVQPAVLRVRRTGPTTSALAVQYREHPSAGGENDYEALPGEVVIPAGVSAATFMVIPKFVDSPAPIHVHRSSLLTNVVQNSPDYALGGESKASIRLRFDIAVFECVPAPVVPATTPTVPSTTPAVPATAAPAAAPAAATPAATLPSTGAPRTGELAGVALVILGLGMAGVRYGRPRRLRIRAGWR